MYRAKEAGRNRVTVVEDLTATDRERLSVAPPAAG